MHRAAVPAAPAPAGFAATEAQSPSPAADAGGSGTRFLGFLRRKALTSEPAVAPETQLALLESTVETPPAGPSMTDAETATAGPAAGSIPESSRKPRPFGFLIRRTPGKVLAAGTPEAGPEQTTVPIQAALALPNDAPTRGVVAGLPFGQIVPVCGVSIRDLGTEVAKSAGSGKYRLYDNDPSSLDLRPQFLTGFADGCARQFSASLALFGSSEVHEATRYNPLNTNPYSETDRAYEKTKAQICGVGRGKSCPEGRRSQLARNTAFVSVYREFGDTGLWQELFLHKGKLVSLETRTN